MRRTEHKPASRTVASGLADALSMAGAALLVLLSTVALVGAVGFLVVASLL